MHDEDAELLLIYSTVDELLRAGEFEQVDNLLLAQDWRKLPLVQLLAYVSITDAAKHRLKRRHHFMERVKVRLRRETPDRIDELLKGFV